MEDNGTKQPRVFNVEYLRKDIFTEYETRIAPLVKEQADLTAELEKMAESTPNLVAMGEARIRLLERQYDEKIAAGDIEGGATVRTEIEGVQKNVEKLSGRAEAIYQRQQAIDKEKLAAANKTLAVCFPDFQKFTFAALNAAFDLLTGAADILDEFGRATGARVSVMNHHNALRPYARGRGKAIYEKIREWFKE
ncbi:MAG: hypothetical protein ABSD38_05575 [Syntrophorhabdales bacterium]|jgi:hypothetical protein